MSKITYSASVAICAWLYVSPGNAEAQVSGAFTFPTGTSINTHTFDNPQYRVQVSETLPESNVFVQLNVDGFQAWNGTVNTPGGSGELMARISSFPLDSNLHTITAHWRHPQTGVWTQFASRPNVRVSSEVTTYGIILHVMNEGGDFQSGWNFDAVNFFDTRAGTEELYFYDSDVDPIPDALTSQCASTQRPQYRLWRIDNHSVPAWCTDPTYGHPTSTNNFCDDWENQFQGLINENERFLFTHVFVVNSMTKWVKINNVWTATSLNGVATKNAVDGGLPGISVVVGSPNLSQFGISTTIVHELGHRSGLGHADEPSSNPLNDCNQAIPTRNVMCAVGFGRELVSSQCSAMAD